MFDIEAMSCKQPIPSNLATLNERTFRPADSHVLLDNETRQYRPKMFNVDENTWSYHCRIDPKKDISIPSIGETVVLRDRSKKSNIWAIVEESFFRRPCQNHPKDVKQYISSTVGVVVLRAHPKSSTRPLKYWHHINSR